MAGRFWGQGKAVQVSDCPVDKLLTTTTRSWQIPYYPNPNEATGAQHLIVQGDDNGAIYVLMPTDQDFVYAKAELRLYGDRVGLPALGE